MCSILRILSSSKNFILKSLKGEVSSFFWSVFGGIVVVLGLGFFVVVFCGFL